MITRLFLKLTDYALFRRLLWKPIYEVLAKKFTVKNWSFMNYGYAPLPQEPALSLAPADEINRYPIGLYHYLAGKINLEGWDVLEVGSGRGGGAAYLKKYLRPAKVMGVDIALQAVKRANQYFGAGGLGFVQGSAERLPFAPGSFDAVINVESSHTYGSVPQFLSEVQRVLRKGGYLLLADIRVAKDMALLREQLRACGLQLVSEENISPNVAMAIEQEEPVKQQRIKEHVPSWLQGVFKEFSGVVGSQAHSQLKSGELVYYRFVLRK
ncbi:class I SAM-dependent methyltransferase [Paraflavisolibacter sp. H34]|uniref:class I SAM-dependent methyltransferase n=1 Tax=Huijunlia imazamoxiresistens TaxID=3127457 RepID=UPI0030188007